MYEDQTFKAILTRMLDKIPNTLDKREGSIVYNALAPEAAELTEAYIKMDTIMQETFASTAQDYNNLKKRAAERGLKPDPASKAILKAEFKDETGSYIDVPIDSIFTLEDLSYKAIEKISLGIFKIECQTAGQEGSSELGQLIPSQYIANLAIVEATEVLTPGEDEEPIEEFRDRYLNSLQGEAYGGNIVDYKQKVSTIAGVGGLRVSPVWNGGGTVKIIFINSDFDAPSTALVDDVQSAVDPTINSGEGFGIAPIGHSVTVEAIKQNMINIATTIIFQEGYVWADVETNAIAAIEEYFDELNQGWWNPTQNEVAAEELPIVIRISQIEVRLLNLTGIIDIAGTTINTLEENKVLNYDEMPVLGGITT